jgi:hypothetical protein
VTIAESDTDVIGDALYSTRPGEVITMSLADDVGASIGVTGAFYDSER